MISFYNTKPSSTTSVQSERNRIKHRIKYNYLAPVTQTSIKLSPTQLHSIGTRHPGAKGFTVDDMGPTYKIQNDKT